MTLFAQNSSGRLVDMSFLLNLLDKWTRRKSTKDRRASMAPVDNVSVLSEESVDSAVSSVGSHASGGSSALSWNATTTGNHRKRRIDDFLHSLSFYFGSWLDDADLQTQLLANPRDAFLIAWPRRAEERSPTYRKWHLVLLQKDEVMVKVKVVYWRKTFVIAHDKAIGLDEFIRAQGLRMIRRPWNLRPEQITHQLPITPNLAFPLDANVFPLGRLAQRTMNFDVDRRIPVMTMEVTDLSPEERTALLAEAERFQHFGSTRIWRLWGFVNLSESVTLVLEDIFYGSVAEYIRSSHRGHQQLRNFAVHMAEGLRYLEKRGVVHRRLSLDVCLLTYQYNVKLALFGLSEGRLCTVDDDLEDVDRCRWVPPDCLPYRDGPHLPYDSSSMVYTFGTMLWSMFHLAVLPFEDDPAERIRDRAYRLENAQLPVDETLMPEDMAAVSLRCWEPNQFVRGRFKELKKTLRKLRDHAEQTK
uniref:Protein kinase domain-containing protein n=1 Tax=Steinernema glaseri TaxID=37863 RepID=A0A1I8AS81_9BILA